MIKYKNYLFKYGGLNIITNIHFSEIALDEIPLSVKSSREFSDRDSLMKYIHIHNVKTPIAIKCAYEIGVKNGESMRDVPQFALFGHLQDKTPFIISDLQIHGKDSNLHYNAIIEITQNKGKAIYNNRKKPEMQFPYHTISQWKYYKIPVKSTLGKVITWYVTSENVPKPIPYNQADIKANHEVKFRDKRPNYRENLAPDGTHAGKKGVGCPLDNTPKKYYLVKFVDSKTGEIHWKRQNNCQLRDIDIKAEIAAGNIKEL